MAALICVLGRQPGIGIAELEALMGAGAVTPFGSNCAIVRGDTNKISQRDLGGTMKIAEIIATMPSANWGGVSSASLGKIINYATNRWAHQEHKLSLGLSVYGFNVKREQIWRLSFELKKRLKEKGHSARVTLGQDQALNSAQVIYNKLISEFGAEFILVADSKQTHIARTISVQDIERYSKRDYGKPGRDTKVGMLPPKLAQIMLNLAGVSATTTVLDPFCGTGVVLMEAALKHAKLMGSDLRSEMVETTKKNLEWLSEEYGFAVNTKGIVCADATTTRWKGRFDRVVSEIYLGPALTKLPKDDSFDGIVSQCNNLLKKFMVNLRPQLSKGSRCCIAVPVWNTPKGLVRLPLADQLGSLGYEREKFTHTRNDKLIYRRQDQIVARELLVLTAK
ncbi:MAG: TRM11 family SAM-dependent methyltransferase [Candidatus Micrarchaeaceae archaeon]